jgi:hypothetical protein
MATQTPFTVQNASSESSTDTETDLIHRNHHWVRHRANDPRASRLSRNSRRSRQSYPVPIIISPPPPSTSTTSQTATPSLQPTVTASIAPDSRGRPVYVGVVNIGDAQTQSSSSKSQPPTQQSWNWNTVDDRTSANALAICNTGGRANSEHSHHRHHRHCSRHGSPDLPHIPPKDEEVKLTRADEREKRDHDEQLRKDAIRDYQLDLAEKEREKQRILDQAKLEEANKKAELEAQKKAWEAEATQKKSEEEAAKKKKGKEIEQELKDRMARAGYHNVDIQKVIEGKGDYYCHEHQRLHPCSLCISKTTVKETVGRNFFGCKVRRDKICTETLRYFGLLYDYDPVSVSSCASLRYQARANQYD